MAWRKSYHTEVYLPATVEIYGSLGFPNLLFTPKATAYFDVDETGQSGPQGLYLLVSGSHLVPFGLPRFPGFEISSSLGVVNSGFSNYYYGVSESGLHDFSLSFSAPINLGEKWSVRGFLSYSALLGEFRNHQFKNPRAVYLGTAGTPAACADTVWGGAALNLAF